MSLKIRMGIALVLAAVAITCMALTGRDYLAAVRAAAAAHTTVKVPALVIVASLCGLASWALVVVQQWRRRQFGWVVASFLLSYLAIITYAVTTLVRPPASHVHV